LPRGRSLTGLPIGCDLVAIAVFVLLGLHAHHHAPTLHEIANVWYPFAVGALVGWGIVLRGHIDGVGLRGGAVVVVSAVAIGMMLRVVTGQGTASAFIAVALMFLGLFLGGWRLVATRLGRP
jgi:FtsH-binding integral membrane protein